MTDPSERAKTLYERARERPGSFARSKVSELVSLLDASEARTEARAAHALQRIAEHSPRRVAPVVDDITPHLLSARTPDELDEDGTKLALVATLRTVGQEDIDAVVDAAPELTSCLRSPNSAVRNGAAYILSDIADDNPTKVTSATDRLVTMLSDANAANRANATLCLSRVAEADPQAVASAERRLVELLDDADEAVRNNACYALGHAGSERARSKLETLADADPSDDVRHAAEYALHTLDRGASNVSEPDTGTDTKIYRPRDR